MCIPLLAAASSSPATGFDLLLLVRIGALMLRLAFDWPKASGYVSEQRKKGVCGREWGSSCLIALEETSDRRMRARWAGEVDRLSRSVGR